LFYLHYFSQGLSWIRDRLSVASRSLQLLPPRDRPSRQADRNDQHPRAALPSWLGLSPLPRPGEQIDQEATRQAQYDEAGHDGDKSDRDASSWQNPAPSFVRHLHVSVTRSHLGWPRAERRRRQSAPPVVNLGRNASPGHRTHSFPSRPCDLSRWTPAQEAAPPARPRAAEMP
jgi:hypothetical protein